MIQFSHLSSLEYSGIRAAVHCKINRAWLVGGSTLVLCVFAHSVVFIFNTIFVSSHMYPENPEGTQVIVGSMNMGYTLEPHYNAHFGIHTDISSITERLDNESLIHRKYKQWEPCLCYKQMSAIKEGVIMRLQCISDTSRNRTHNLFRPKREPIPLGHNDELSIMFLHWGEP